MHFEDPQILWLLWLLPPLGLLFVLAARRREDALSRFAEQELLDRMIERPSLAGRLLRGALLGGALAGLFFALAGPRWGFQWEEVHRRGVDVVVALDLSNSMLAEDVKPDRLTTAKREIRDLMDLLQGDRVGLVAFAGMAYVQCPLTLDYRALEVFLDQMDPRWVPVGGTNLAAAVRTGIAAFSSPDRSGRALLLITDGEDHSGELQEAAEEAKAEGVHVFVVGIGAPEGAPIPNGQGGFIKEDGKIVLTKLDEASLKELAITTGGAYVRAAAGDLDLRQIYLEDIKGTLEARELSSSRQRRWEQRFQWPLGVALLLLMMESTLLRPRRRRKGPAGKGVDAVNALVLALSLLPVTFAPREAQAGWFGADDAESQGHDAYAEGRHQEALDQWIRAQVEHPEDPRIDYNIGSAHYRLGDFAAAEDAFLAATATDRTELAADAFYGAGDAAFQQGKYQEAIAHYEQALELRPEDEDAEANRDLAQRRYEELLDQANEQQDQDEDQDEQQEQQDGDSEPGDPSDGEQGQESEDGSGEQQQKKDQQQGQGASEQQPDQEQQDGEGEGDADQEDPAEQQGNDDKPPADDQQEAQGGAAEAADIDRSGEPGEDAPSAGALGEQTEGEEGEQEGGRAVVEGALSDEQAEALLRALEADQEHRRKERTQREGERSGRAVVKDW